MENNPGDNDRIMVKISDIMKKVKSKEDMINVMREKGKKYINYF